MNRGERGERGVCSRGETGAAAVEFALVSTLLFTVMFGIIQYGLFFNDALSLRQGVREAARMGVVENFGSSPCTGTSSAKLACTAVAQIGALTGTPVVKVSAPTWAPGGPLKVCAVVKSTGAVGLLPLPNGGFLRSETQMTIEQDNQNKLTPWADNTPVDPTGQDWSWC